jgi:outer membrane protein assembly factor BamB
MKAEVRKQKSEVEGRGMAATRMRESSAAVLSAVLAASVLLAVGAGCGKKQYAPVVDSALVAPYGPCLDSASLTVCAHDPDGDSVRLRVQWGDNSDTVTDFYASPCRAELKHGYSDASGATVIVAALDMNNISIPETTTVPVEPFGRVQWFWWSSDPENPCEPLTTSAVIAIDAADERLFSGCKGDYNFYSIRTSDRGGELKATTRWPEYDFTGHPGFCAATNHVIVGSDEGELYALKLDGLYCDWRWPGKPSEESLTGIEWGAPAFNGNRIYIGHYDDSLFYFLDYGVQATRVAAYGVHASVIDAPIVDASGNVIFGTDSGYLVKIDGNLISPIWRSKLLRNGEVHSPLLGSDGTIYCASDSFRLFAIDPATGVVKSGWPLTLDGDVFRPVLGRSALFVGATFGKVYSINPATGVINWQKSLTQTSGFRTAPVVAANGYVYFQDDDDVLYCLNQADGTVNWACNCPLYLPRTNCGSSHQPRRLQLTDYRPNPSICANGNIIVVGADACYCVAGYPEGPLDPLAPWPKWQHDLYNTGHVGGGK